MNPTLLNIALADTSETGRLMAADLLDDLDRGMEAVVLRMGRAITEPWQELGETQHYWIRVYRDRLPQLILISKRTNGTRYMLQVGDCWRRFDWTRRRGCTLRPATPHARVAQEVQRLLEEALAREVR